MVIVVAIATTTTAAPAMWMVTATVMEMTVANKK